MKKAEFIGYMGVEVGKPLALYNVGVVRQIEGFPSMIGGKACVSGPENRRLPRDDQGESFGSRTFEGEANRRFSRE